MRVEKVLKIKLFKFIETVSGFGRDWKDRGPTWIKGSYFFEALAGVGSHYYQQFGVLKSIVFSKVIVDFQVMFPEVTVLTYNVHPLSYPPEIGVQQQNRALSACLVFKLFCCQYLDFETEVDLWVFEDALHVSAIFRFFSDDVLEDEVVFVRERHGLHDD